MPIKKGKKTDSSRDISVSFRVTEDTRDKIAALANYGEQSQADVVTILVNDEYERIRGKDPGGLRKAESSK